MNCTIFLNTASGRTTLLQPGFQAEYFHPNCNFYWLKSSREKLPTWGLTPESESWERGCRGHFSGLQQRSWQVAISNKQLYWITKTHHLYFTTVFLRKLHKVKALNSFYLVIIFFPLSCTALWQQNCNLNTFYAKQICFAKGSFKNIKLPLMPINCPFICFCLQHVIEPNRTGGWGKRKSKEEETEQK